MNMLITGFSGAGKSTLLKKLQNIKVFDLDQELENDFQGQISGFVAKYGWEEFRRREFAKLLEILIAHKDQNVVVALGGGTLDLEKIKILRQCIWVRFLYLKQTFEECYGRIQNDQNRPLVQNNTKEELHKIYQERTLVYDCADFTVQSLEEGQRLLSRLVKE